MPEPMKEPMVTKYLAPLLLRILLLALFAPTQGKGQTQEEDSLQVMFYNVENLFDTINNPTTRDDDFTPGGSMHWTHYKQKKKQRGIYQVIMAMGEWNPPAIIGLCEVENRAVLEALANHTPLSAFRYGIVHRDSPDRRGIDVALLYRKTQIQLLDAHYLPFHYPADTSVRSRDILHATFRTGGDDTLHVFVNHWPSRRGGRNVSEPRRIASANIVRRVLDSLQQNNSCVNILILGDFNDSPQDISLTTHLQAQAPKAPYTGRQLYNLAYHGKGTHKYHHYWSMLDQIIVSGSLLQRRNMLYTEVTDFRIGDFDFLFTDDVRYGGEKLFRTYQGPKYLGGYSDHLPVSVMLRFAVD